MSKYLCFFMLLMASIKVFAAPITQNEIPGVLQDWQAWVLYDKPEHACPFLYNNSATRYCAWPTQLALNTELGRISFTQTWEIFSTSMVALPGEALFWPQNVQVNGQYAPVIDHEGIPMIELSPGIYQVKGFLPYRGKLPESIQIPANTALVQGNHPQIDENGRLFLHHVDHEVGNQNTLNIRVFRRLIQGIPMMVETLIELDVGGGAREVELGPVLLPGTNATRIDSSLPAQLTDAGLLRVQLRPGQWQILLTGRFLSEVDTLKRAEVGPPWPAEEIWSFALDPQLGVLGISGVPHIDPTQTAMPEDWRNLPAYRVLVAEPVLLTFHQDNVSHNDLTLTRKMWLNFSGQLWTVSDAIQGVMNTDWRLSLSKPFLLGNFKVNDKEQLITLLTDAKGNEVPGVEVRHNPLDVMATSFLDNVWHFPVAGWDKTFQTVETTLYLPPGWQLFTALGADTSEGTVLNEWSLWDIFIVLLLTFALSSVLGFRWGGIAFIMLLLTYHEVGAPRLLWLNIIVVLWILQYVKLKKMHTLLSIYRDVSFAIVAIMLVFLVSHSLVNSLYPQIEPDQKMHPMPMAAETMLMEARPMAKKSMVDPLAVPIDAKTQTGPGLPTWQWEQVKLYWQSNVDNTDTVYLLLVSPLMQRILTVLQIILLIAVWVRLWQMRQQVLSFYIPFKQANVFLIPLLLMLSFTSMPGHAQDIPDEGLLETLQARLLAQDDCLPHCASISQAALNINSDELHLILQVDALANVAVPIPGRAAYWQVEEVLVDNMPATALNWQDNMLWVNLDKGMHTIAMQGSVKDIDKLSLTFPLVPHWFDVQSQNWFVEGVENQQLSGDLVHLSRQGKAQDNTYQAATITPFARVIRTLTLGITGEVTTTVERIAPLSGVLQLEIPLLPHETMHNANIQVYNNNAHLYFAPDVQEISWQSSIAHFNDLTLLAPDTQEWIEEWHVMIAPIWHPMITGIAPLNHPQQDTWQLVWKPWPLQSVHVQLSRPQAMTGQTTTIEKVNVLTDINTRGQSFTLQALLRSTLGEVHTLVLPENVIVDNVRMNGIVQPPTDSNTLLLPLSPGNNWIDIVWHSKENAGLFIQTPKLDWAMPAYNIHLGLNIPDDRFVIALGGPGYSGALLYWMWIVAAIIVAVVLSKIIKTPLRLWQWLVLTIGLSIVTPFLGLWVVLTIVLLSMREKLSCSHRYLRWATQILFSIFIIAALIILGNAVYQGLHGAPNMQYFNSQLSSDFTAQYVWLQDISTHQWPRAFVIALPVFVYRIFMLLWSLWLVWLLLRLAPFAWQVIAAKK